MYFTVKSQAIDAEFSPLQMILEKFEVLTLKIYFTAEDFFFFLEVLLWKRVVSRGSSQRRKVCFCTINFTQTQKEYLSEMQTRLLQSAPITSTENPENQQKGRKKKKGSHVLFNKPSSIPKRSSKRTSLDLALHSELINRFSIRSRGLGTR